MPIVFSTHNADSENIQAQYTISLPPFLLFRLYGEANENANGRQQMVFRTKAASPRFSPAYPSRCDAERGKP